MSGSARTATRRSRLNAGRLALSLYTAAFLGFSILPIAIVVIASFSSSPFITFPMEGYSLRWYARVLEYRPFLQSLGFSVQLAFVSATLAAVIATPAALALARSDSRWAETVVSLLLSPISIPAIMLGFSLLYFFAAISIGISYLALLIAHTVVSIPYILRTVLSVYRNLPASIEESAAILGANRYVVLFRITLPLLKSGIFAGMLFAILISLDNLPISYFFGSSSTNTLPVVMLSYLQHQFDPSIAAIATIQMIIAVFALLIVERVFGISKIQVS